MDKINISKGLFGLDKKQVEEYIKDVEADFRVKISEKDEQINNLTKENEELQKKLEKYIADEEKLRLEKEAIGCVLIKAQEQANQMIEQSKNQFENEKTNLEKIVEKERENLLDVKKDIGILKKTIVTTLEKYVKELEKLESAEVSTKTTKGKKPKKEEE